MKKMGKLLFSAIIVMLLISMLPLTSFAVNPYLPLWEYIPDGEPYVFEDPDNPGEYRFYIFGSHDTRLSGYCGPDFVLWSAPVDDLSNFRYEGVIFQYKAPGAADYDLLFAPDIQERIEDGVKVYYLFPNSQAGGRSTMIAKSVGDPRGPYVPCNLNGAGTASTGVVGFDPSVFIDDDGRVYGYWGFEHLSGAELTDDFTAVKNNSRINDMIVSSTISSPSVNDPQRFSYFEAPSMRKIDGAYILVYARKGMSGEVGGTASAMLAYAYSFESPLGPWTYGGVIVNASGEHVKSNGEPATNTSDNMGSFNGHNTHGGLVEINGQWYITYHRATDNSGYSRQATMEAVNVIVNKENKTVSIPEVQMTSEGWQTSGLNPYKNYSAGIACYHTGNAYVKANRDQEANSNTVANLLNNAVVGYKYFNFDINAPEGTCTYLNIGIIPSGNAGYIDVYVDRPNTISGELLGTFQIAAGLSGYTSMTIPMTELDDIDGKHAIFFKIRSSSGSIGELYELEFVASEKTGKPLYSTVSLGKNDIAISETTTLKLTSKMEDNSIVDNTANATVVAKNPLIATYADGVITGVSNGTAGFEVTYGDFSETVYVKVGTPLAAGQTYEKYPALKDVYKDYFTLGIFGAGETNALIHNYASYAPGNEMKPDSVQSVKGTFTYNSANNAFNNLSSRNPDMLFYGHTLAWHSQSPSWMWDAPPARYDQPGTYDRATAIANLNNHIENVMGYYGERLVGMDVVNEAIGTSNPNDWKASLAKGEGWYMALGWEWVELAFLKAAEVVDENGWDCKLIYNDFGLDSPAKARVVYEMVKDINERYKDVRPNGKPLIEVIGMQCHYGPKTNVADVEKNIQLFATLPGVSINITEMDIGCPPIGTLTPDNANNQAVKFAELFQIFMKYAKGPANTTSNPKVIDRVSICGVRDATSGWRAGEFALLFDSNGLAKESLIAVLNPGAYLAEHDYIESEPEPEPVKTDGVFVYDMGNGDSWSGANIILGNSADAWPWSTAAADGKVAFVPEKDATYRVSVNVTSTGTNAIRVRWLKDSSNGNYTEADGAVVNNYTYRATDVSTTIPAYFNSGMTTGESYTLVTEIKLDGSQSAEGLIGNIAIRGGGGGNAFSINWITVEKVGAEDTLLVNWPEGIREPEPEPVINNGVEVFHAANGDSQTYANIYLGNDSSVWPWSTAGADGTIAFVPEKNASYRIKFNVTSTGATQYRVRWMRNAEWGGNTDGDAEVVTSTPPYNTAVNPNSGIARVMPANFQGGITNGSTVTLTLEITMDGDAPENGLIGNIGLRGGSGSTAFNINWITVEKIGAEGKLLVNWPEGVKPDPDPDPEPELPAIKLSANKKLIANGEYFDVAAEFDDVTVNSNTAVVTYEYDSSKFEYRGFTPADGLSILKTDANDGYVSITIGNLGAYGIDDLGSARFSARTNVELQNETSTVAVDVVYVDKGEDGVKSLLTAESSIIVRTRKGGDVTLIDLSNLIDLFGANEEGDNWDDAVYFDYNENGEIDILDIGTLASKIK